MLRALGHMLAPEWALRSLDMWLPLKRGPQELGAMGKIAKCNPRERPGKESQATKGLGKRLPQ